MSDNFHSLEEKKENSKICNKIVEQKISVKIGNENNTTNLRIKKQLKLIRYITGSKDNEHVMFCLEMPVLSVSNV